MATVTTRSRFGLAPAAEETRSGGAALASPSPVCLCSVYERGALAPAAAGGGGSWAVSGSASATAEEATRLWHRDRCTVARPLRDCANTRACIV